MQPTVKRQLFHSHPVFQKWLDSFDHRFLDRRQTFKNSILQYCPQFFEKSLDRIQLRRVGRQMFEPQLLADLQPRAAMRCRAVRNQTNKLLFADEFDELIEKRLKTLDRHIRQKQREQFSVARV